MIYINNIFKRIFGNFITLPAIIAGAVNLLMQFGVKIDFGKYQLLAVAVLFVIYLVGVINNPTTKSKGLSDDIPAAWLQAKQVVEELSVSRTEMPDILGQPTILPRSNIETPDISNNTTSTTPINNQ